MSGESFMDGRVVLHCGDCLEVMASFESNSVDAFVTDPPYGLEFMGREWDGADGFRRALNAADVGRESVFGRTSRKSPEYKTGPVFQQFMHAMACEALRVLKPGGHLVAFAGTRTYHRLACAIDDAGFEVRDMLSWLYGSGFPKSLDVAKAMDKRGGALPRTARGADTFSIGRQRTGICANAERCASA
jgi:DNA modification methylase